MGLGKFLRRGATSLPQVGCTICCTAFFWKGASFFPRGVQRIVGSGVPGPINGEGTRPHCPWDGALPPLEEQH